MIAALLMLADAPVDTKSPHRVAIERMAISGNIEDAAGCAARKMSRKFTVTNYPMSDGIGMDFALDMPIKLYSGGPSYLGFQFRKDDGGGFVTVLYRRPFTASGAVGAVKDVAKTCFAGDWASWEAASKERK